MISRVGWSRNLTIMSCGEAKVSPSPVGRREGVLREKARTVRVNGLLGEEKTKKTKKHKNPMMQR